jgi:VanZ family protein
MPVAAYGGAVFYLSSLSRTPVPARIPDTLLHAVEYAGLTLLILRALNGGLLRRIPARVHLLGVGLAVLYGISDEMHQLFVARRTASLKDVLSDMMGAVLAAGAAEVLQRFVSRRRTATPLAVVLYTRRECHLCRDARDILLRFSREFPLQVSEVDVDADPVLVERYGSEVPVVIAGGAKISKLRPDEEAIRRRLFRRIPGTA